MKLAWIENDRIRDIAHDDPYKIYHPDIAKFYDTQVPDNAANGDGWIDGKVVKPEPPIPLPPESRMWSQTDVRKGLTLSEKAIWDAETAPAIKTVKIEMENPTDEVKTHELLKFLVDSSVISQTSMDKIMDGYLVTPVNVLP